MQKRDWVAIIAGFAFAFGMKAAAEKLVANDFGAKAMALRWTRRRFSLCWETSG
jgi:hypothetical protein